VLPVTKRLSRQMTRTISEYGLLAEGDHDRGADDHSDEPDQCHDDD